MHQEDRVAFQELACKLAALSFIFSLFFQPIHQPLPLLHLICDLILPSALALVSPRFNILMIPDNFIHQPTMKVDLRTDLTD